MKKEDLELLSAVLILAAAVIPLVAGLFKKRRSRLVVRWIRKKDDRDLAPALALCARLLPDNEIDNPAEFVRWMDEIELETKENRCRLKDYFIIAKCRDAVCGVLYAHYYLFDEMMFISYVAVDEQVTIARQGKVAIALFRYLSLKRKKELGNMRGIVFELEYPDPKNKHQNLECRARWRHFQLLARMMGIAVKRIDIDYRQPRLSLWEDTYKEEKLLLLYGRTQPPELGEAVTRDEVERVLSFVYRGVYGDHFEDNPTRDREYREYLDQLYARAVADLPSYVALIPSASGFSRSKKAAHRSG